MEMHAEPKSNRFNRVKINFNFMLNVLSVNLYIIPLLYMFIFVNFACYAKTWVLKHNNFPLQRITLFEFELFPNIVETFPT